MPQGNKLTIGFLNYVHQVKQLVPIEENLIGHTVQVSATQQLRRIHLQHSTILKAYYSIKLLEKCRKKIGTLNYQWKFNLIIIPRI